MATKNDTKILQLKERIEEKRAELKSTPRFAPITNCNIRFNGDNYNLHATNEDQLVFLLCSLKALLNAAKDLGYDDKLTCCGYKVTEWISDIEQKLKCIYYKTESAKLNRLESTLNDMLSSDKKIELELENIADLLG